MTKRAIDPTPKQIDALRSYLDEPNHGRGMFYGVTGQLYRAGYLDLDWSSTNTWTLTISLKGRQALDRIGTDGEPNRG